MALELKVIVDPETFAPILTLIKDGIPKQKICDIEPKIDDIPERTTIEVIDDIMEMLNPNEFTSEEIVFVKQSLIDRTYSIPQQASII